MPDTANSARTSPVTNTQLFTRGEGVYNFLFGNGTFGLNNGGGVDYTVTFNVTETPVQPPTPPIFEVSAPSSLTLFSGMLMMAFGVKRTTIKKQKRTD